ncbi:hypothetical protein ABZS96_25895 [Streptomyces avermitilis]|uniref:hypothetical protein n=1 Tax=Streptomyces avermitilis TaxID=33903 RepID=UPI0033B1E16C
MTLQYPDAAGISFASIATAMHGVDPDVLHMIPLLASGASEAFLVVWPPDTPAQECRHNEFEESAVILAGELIDEDNTKHGQGDLWQRPAAHVHHPRSGPEGARVLLWRVRVP